MTPTDSMTKLRAATAQVAWALADMAQAVEDGEIRAFGNVGAGETTPVLAHGLRLLIEVLGTADDESANQLLGALSRYLEDHA